MPAWYILHADIKDEDLKKIKSGRYDPKTKRHKIGEDVFYQEGVGFVVYSPENSDHRSYPWRAVQATVARKLGRSIILDPKKKSLFSDLGESIHLKSKEKQDITDLLDGATEEDLEDLDESDETIKSLREIPIDPGHYE